MAVLIETEQGSQVFEGCWKERNSLCSMLRKWNLITSAESIEAPPDGFGLWFVVVKLKRDVGKEGVSVSTAFVAPMQENDGQLN